MIQNLEIKDNLTLAQLNCNKYSRRKPYLKTLNGYSYGNSRKHRRLFLIGGVHWRMTSNFLVLSKYKKQQKKQIRGQLRQKEAFQQNNISSIWAAHHQFAQIKVFWLCLNNSCIGKNKFLKMMHITNQKLLMKNLRKKANTFINYSNTVIKLNAFHTSFIHHIKNTLSPIKTQPSVQRQNFG